jgi:hypothetical protein
MPNPIYAVPALILLAAGPAAAPAAPVPGSAWDRAAALAQHITIHVPRITVTSTTIVTRSAPAAPAPRPMYREKKADDCVKMKKIIGFALSSNEAIELVLDDGTRLRARFGSDCPALGFYSGFYVKPHPDGKICAKRDLLRSRMGKTCAIGRFTRLLPAK